jgi:carboxyl-terminal processing protease
LNPIFDTPAYRAGIRAGDLILEIDGRPASKMKLNDAVESMKGPPGTRVTLVIQHAAADAKPVRLEITRELIRTKSVLGDRLLPDGHWSYFLEAEPRIGYVRITTFGEYTASELREVLPFADHPIDALILDLRGNVGGLLDAAVETCDMFIDEGTIVSTRGRHADQEVTFSAQRDNTIFNRATPLVVLVDRVSASASEIVAACLQDHQRATIAGQRTWGKGTVQNVIPLENDTSALKLTTASYWRPNGTNIHRAEGATDADVWGVRPSPELEVILTDEQYVALYEQRSARDVLAEEGGAKVPSAHQTPPMVDLQLQRAVEFLKRKP